MATKPLNAFTVQESNNLQVYEDYYQNEINISTSYATLFDQASTNGPAKQAIIYASNSAGIEATDVISLVLNGKAEDGTYPDGIIINIIGSMLPFTIDNLIVTKIRAKTSDDDAAERLSVLAFI